MKIKIFLFILLCQICAVGYSENVSESYGDFLTAKNDPSLDNLKNAWSIAVNMPEDPKSKKWQTLKENKLNSLLYVLQLMAGRLDSLGPIELNGVLNVAVPGDDNMKPGTHPNEIKDPKIRKQYLAAIDENK
ncbi:MAG: hypothetical protein ABI615_11105 [Chthoniobacterales bacterium]